MRNAIQTICFSEKQCNCWVRISNGVTGFMWRALFLLYFTFEKKILGIVFGFMRIVSWENASFFSVCDGDA